MAIPGLDRLVDNVAASIGLAPDLIRVAACLVLSYPLCAILKRLPDDRKTLKEVYCAS